VEAAVQHDDLPARRALRTSLSAASLASAPELAKNTPPPSERAREPLGQPHHRAG
jgi:hypothetical protein